MRLITFDNEKGLVALDRDRMAQVYVAASRLSAVYPGPDGVAELLDDEGQRRARRQRLAGFQQVVVCPTRVQRVRPRFRPKARPEGG